VSAQETARAVDRDVFLLIALIGIATALFLVTRNVAARQHETDTRIAATWFVRGQRQMDSGSAQQAIDSFRNAVAGDRENRRYAFALADALAAADRNQEAEQTVLRLREFDPENAEINLVLARLESKNGDLPEAIHYYENAIYGRWTGSQVDERRREARTELIQFLLARKQRDRAVSELLVLEGDLPATATSHVQGGELFLQAGDSEHALKNFREALKFSPQDEQALFGAGQASFQLGDYVEARRYMRASLAENHQLSQAEQLLSLVNAVLSRDPMSPHLSVKVRQQRLVADFDQAFLRLQSCMGQAAKRNDNSGLEGLANEANKLRPNLRVQRIRRDPDLVSLGLDLIFRMETATNMACGEAAGSDKALVLIANKHRR
jgi:tetratricopeptide (TPR) repeat protein